MAAFAWVLVWAGEAYFALLPANDSPSALHGMLAGMADGEPRLIASLDRVLANVVAHQGVVGPALGALFALCALAVFLPPGLAKPLYGLAMALALVTWLGQDFGGILTGQGTDPNSGPLLFLLSLAYWPLRPQPSLAPATAVRSRPPILRTGVAVASAALVAASSVAAASGITSLTATASVRQSALTASSRRLLGPGPVLSHYALGPYRLLFRDVTNRATKPGTVSLELSRSGRPLNGDRVTVTYHSLDMKMPSHIVSPRSVGHGSYSAAGPKLAMGGRWRITVSVSQRHGPSLLVTLTDLITV